MTGGDSNGHRGKRPRTLEALKGMQVDTPSRDRAEEQLDRGLGRHQGQDRGIAAGPEPASRPAARRPEQPAGQQRQAATSSTVAAMSARATAACPPWPGQALQAAAANSSAVPILRSGKPHEVPVMAARKCQ